MLHLESVDHLITIAKERRGWRFDADVARYLGVGSAYVNEMRTGRRWPADEKVLMLAEAAEVDPIATLIEVNYMRATSDQAREAWLRALRFLRSSTAAAFIATALVGTESASWTVERPANLVTSEFAPLYLMRHFVLRRRALFRAIARITTGARLWWLNAREGCYRAAGARQLALAP